MKSAEAIVGWWVLGEAVLLVALFHYWVPILFPTYPLKYKYYKLLLDFNFIYSKSSSFNSSKLGEKTKKNFKIAYCLEQNE